jgi:ferric iron reductase protein FhuF
VNAGATDAPADPLLDRLAGLSAYGALDGPEAAGELGLPLHDPGPLVEHVAAQLGTTDTMVAASVAFQAVTSRVAVPVVVANQLLGRSLAAPFAALRWRVVDRQIRLGLTELVEGPPLPWPELVDGFVHQTVEPWVAAMRSNVRIARRLLWGNAADSLIGALRQALDLEGRRSDLRGLSDAALPALPVADLMTVDAEGELRRKTCCLIDKVPGYGRCTQCSLRCA